METLTEPTEDCSHKYSTAQVRMVVSEEKLMWDPQEYRENLYKVEAYSL